MSVDREPRLISHDVLPPIVINVESQPDPNPPLVFRGFPATQKLIESYELTLNGRKFVFPNVWGLQTSEIGQDGEEKTELYFNPAVGQTMSDAMFRSLHPKEAYIDDIINGRVEIPTPSNTH